ncbi:MAG: DUF86 domain-containing protein [Cryomorphaceae bacterium]|nr:DUF86 domain-containing protein [Cryomorphaceae bacterium]
MKDRHIESQKRLEHIDKSIAEIEKYVEGVDVHDFCENDMLNNAVLLKFIIIGEAIIHIEKEKLDKYDYAWYKVRSFRNMIAHEYFNIKLTAVWEIIQKDLPQLKSVIRTILTKEF